MDLKSDLIYAETEAENDRILQDDLDYISGSNIPFEKLKNTTILITGATGLVGVSLTRALLCINRTNRLNMRILALVRSPEKARRIYKRLLDREDLNLIVGDVNEEVKVKSEIDYIIHCASVTTSKMRFSPSSIPAPNVCASLAILTGTSYSEKYAMHIFSHKRLLSG